MSFTIHIKSIKKAMLREGDRFAFRADGAVYEARNISLGHVSYYKHGVLKGVTRRSGYCFLVVEKIK